MTGTPIETAVQPGSARSTLALALGCTSLLAVLLRLGEVAAVRPLPAASLAGAGLCLAAVIAFVLLQRRGGTSSAARAGALALAASGFALSGFAEVPPWPSIESFGQSGWFAPLTTLLLAAVLRRVLRRPAWEAALVLFVVLTAFGGPLFVHSGFEFHALLTLFVAVAALDLGDGFPRRARDVPFALPFLLLAAVALLPLATSVDRDLHLAGWRRLLLAGFPLFALGGRADGLIHATRAIRVFAAMTVVGAACAAIAVLEAGHYFDLGLALKARLQLFGEHPNIIAPYFSVAPPLLLALLLTRARLALRVELIVGLVAGLGALALTRSRASAGGAAVGVAAFLVLLPLVRLHRRMKSPGRTAAIVLALALLAAGGAFVARGKIAAKLNDSSAQFRVYMWHTAVTAIAERPLLGYGFVTSDPLVAHAEPSDLDGRSKATHPHNLLLAFALGAGVPAAALFLLLIGFFAVRVLLSAARRDGMNEQVLAVGVVASTLALLACNLLDQGLALNTPFPLHLGLLIGVGSLLVRLEREALGTAPVQPPRPGRFERALWWIVPLTVAGGVLLVLASDRATAHSRTLLRSREFDRACAFANAATLLDPWSLQAGLGYAQALDSASERLAAAEELARVTDVFPLSAQPWERLSTLEYDRRLWQSSLVALGRARDRDRTGPLSNEWALRAGRLLVTMGMREEATVELAGAMRYDPTAPMRIEWLLDEQKEYFLPVPNSEVPIYLGRLIEIDREEMSAALETDPVKARRMATTLVKILIQLRRFEFAREIVDEYERSSAPPWRPLQALAIDLRDLMAAEAQAAQEAQDAQDAPKASDPQPVAGEDGSAAAPREVDEASAAADDAALTEEFEGQAGQSMLYLAIGEKALRAGKPADAVAPLEDAIDHIYDMVAEREYVARIIDALFQAHLGSGALDAARARLSGDLYFHPKATDRSRIYCRLSTALHEAGRAGDALDQLEELAGAVEEFAPGRCEDAMPDLARCLAPWLAAGADPSAQPRVDALVERLRRSPPGLLLVAQALHAAGHGAEAAKHLAELRSQHPEWIASTRKRN